MTDQKEWILRLSERDGRVYYWTGEQFSTDRDAAEVYTSEERAGRDRCELSARGQAPLSMTKVIPAREE